MTEAFAIPTRGGILLLIGTLDLPLRRDDNGLAFEMKILQSILNLD